MFVESKQKLTHQKMYDSEKSRKESEDRKKELEQVVSKLKKEDKKPDSTDISDFSFSDLVDIPDLQKLVNHLSDLAGCGIGIFDLNNDILASAGWQKICSVYLRIHPETKKNCFESDRFIEQNRDTEISVKYKCNNGLWDAAYPIFIEEKHIANIFIGQFFFDDEVIDIPYFEQQAKKFGFNKTEYLSYVQELPVISRKKAETLKHFITELAHMLTQMGLSNLILKKQKIEELNTANNQLEESEIKFRTLFEQAGVGVAQVETSTGKFLKLNKKFADMLGYTIDEMEQLTFQQLTHPDDLGVSLNQQSLILKKQINEFSAEKRYIRKDGTIFWTAITVSSMWELTEKDQKHILVVQDISERKKSEQELLESELKFRKLFEQAGVGVAQVQISTGKFIKINKKFADMLGYTIDEMLPLTFKHITHPNDLKNSLQNQSMLLEKQINELSTEKRYVRKDGTMVWAMLTVTSMEDKADGSDYQIAVLQDISERKKSEQNLFESELKYRKLFEQAGVGVAQIETSTGRFVKINKKYASMLGYTVEELLLLNFLDFTHPDDIEESHYYKAKFIYEKNAEFSIDKRYIRKDGTIVWVKLTTTSMWEDEEGGRHHISIVQDITANKEVEQDLIESKEHFRSTFYQSPIGLQLYDIDGRLIDCNPACLSLFGIDNVNEINGFNLFEDASLSKQQKRDVRKGKNVGFEIKLDFDAAKKTTRFNTSKSGFCFLGCLATSFKTMGNNKISFLIHVVDNTENKKAQQAIKEENERFQTTMNAIDSLVYAADLENHEILFVNKYGKELFGEIAGKKCYSALQGKTEPCDFCTNHLLLDINGKANPPHIWEAQNLITNKWYECHDQAIQWTSGNLVRFEMANDITKSKENEQSLIENEIKLQELNAAKDKLFSIIAHDLKNPFTVLKSGTELLSRYLDKNDIPKSKAKAAMISKASNNGYALLEDLLIWAKSQLGGLKFEPQKLNFKNRVAGNIAEVEVLAGEKNIHIINEIPEDLVLEADENLLSVVFRNLITNAIKFTNNGGTITINAKIDNDVVEVAVIDTGIGIPKEHQYKLFRIDANFSRVGTANEASTSLGLILCKEFIEKHKGKIWVESEPDKGSEFRFTIPYNQFENNSISIS